MWRTNTILGLKAAYLVPSLSYYIWVCACRSREAGYPSILGSKATSINHSQVTLSASEYDVYRNKILRFLTSEVGPRTEIVKYL